MRQTLVLLFFLFSCSATNKSHSPSTSHINEFKKIYWQDFLAFKYSVESLNTQVNSNSNFDSLRSQIKECRYNYKKIEYIFDYYETEFAKLYINGGPLPKLHKESAEIDIIPPNGLQTLDELTASTDTIISVESIRSISSELNKSLQLIEPSHSLITINEQQLIEALRSGIVRVFTLGLTGFDTPGSGNSMLEAQVSLSTMQKGLGYLKITSNDETKVTYNDLINLYTQASNQVANTDFDSFDRMNFLIKFVNPIYKKLRLLQHELRVPTQQFKNHAQNYLANNLFEEEFIDTDYFSQYTYLPFNNSESIALGKLLFNDPILSKNIDMSCASCHQADKAFTDNLTKSNTNLFGKFTQRNSPTLIDVGYSSKFFWDMRESDLERQVGHVISDSLEFNQSFRAIAARLNQSESYQELFQVVYKDISKEVINSRSISNSIAAYVNSLKSFDSQFDKYVRGEQDKLTEEAKRGFNLFMGKANCGTCHFAPAFNGSVPPFYTDAESEVLGVTTHLNNDSPFILDKDLGRSVNGLHNEAHPHFNNSFKTVTVRNSELTFPYMHNGALKSLDEVMTFYNSGGGVGMGLDIDNQTLAPDSLGLLQHEIDDIIAFLHSLTDTSGMTTPIVNLPSFEGQPYWNQRTIEKIID